MARIVYGVSGEGSGHSSRAREMASHLVQQGHTLKLVSYDRGYRNLKEDFDVFETEGLSIASQDNKVSIVRTFTENLRRLPEGYRSLQRLREVFRSFRPDCVITDFEPMTAYLANHYGLPLVTIDNQHRMRYVKYERPPHSAVDARATKAIIRAMVPRPDVSLVTVFASGETRNDRTFLFPPILRRAVLEKTPSVQGHVLVYLTSGFDGCLDELRKFRRESFLVYGYDRAERDGPLEYRRFSREGFLDDLAASKAVIATAGFTLISEALCLGKPYLALPMQGQFEQQLNGFQLAREEYGKSLGEIDSEAIGDFLYRLPDYRERLKDYRPGDNSRIKAKLDELLADDCALARRFHQLRK
ncbi:MAG: glycosyltransferase family protein [Thermoguttaceae bacterium]